LYKEVIVLFEKFFSSIGFEGVEIKTIIEPASFAPGDKVRGTIFINGGSASQAIEGIELTLFVTHNNEVRDDSDFSYYDEELTQVKVKDLKEIAPNEKKEIPFAIQLSIDHPLSSPVSESFIQTKLLVLNGVDPKDKDVIFIRK